MFVQHSHVDIAVESILCVHDFGFEKLTLVALGKSSCRSRSNKSIEMDGGAGIRNPFAHRFEPQIVEIGL